MNVLNDLAELEKNGVISQETAEKIKRFYHEKSQSSGHRLFTVFAALGAILVGLGIILIIAHNWDDLSQTVRTVFAFVPLLIGQLLCGFTLLKKPEKPEWRESSAAFLFIAIGSSISLVAQIYNISGDFPAFLLTWMLLGLPLVYIMKSSVASLFYLAGITYYACETNYWNSNEPNNYWYWLLFLFILPHYYQLYKKHPGSHFMALHNWLVPISLIITLNTLSTDSRDNNGYFMSIAYFSLFGLFYLIGSANFFKLNARRSNDYLTLGSLGTVVLLLFLSFDFFWKELNRKPFGNIFSSPEFYACVVLTASTGFLFYQRRKNSAWNEMKAIEPVFILFALTFLIGLRSAFAVVLINLMLLGIGIMTIRDGAKRDHLGILNYGLLIIAILVICRFFDTDLSFVIRGLLFVLVGTGFFVANIQMLKKRKNHG